MGWPDERHHQKSSHPSEWPVSSRAAPSGQKEGRP